MCVTMVWPQASLCVGLGCTAPRVRLSVDNNPVAGMLAAKFSDDMCMINEIAGGEQLASTSDSKQPEGTSPPRKAATIVIVDRTFDLNVVLLHDFTYQVRIFFEHSCRMALVVERQCMFLGVRRSCWMSCKLMRM